MARHRAVTAITMALNVRGLDVGVAERIKRAATIRGMTLAAYLAALSALHDAARARADAGDDGLQAELLALGLETVRG